MTKKLIRLTESDFKNIIRESVIMILKENDFIDKDRFDAERKFRDSRDWSDDEEEFEEDPDWYRYDVLGDGADLSDGDLYRGW